MDKNNSQNKTQKKKAAALKYDSKTDNAPRIVASGEGTIAENILAAAREHDIPIEENQDIIDILVKLNIGEEIPEELYQAVAEILSFIYQIEDQK
jgi:flagellar biosynthesis protein